MTLYRHSVHVLMNIPKEPITFIFKVQYGGIAYNSTLKTEVSGSSKTLATTYKTTWCHKPEDHNPHPWNKTTFFLKHETWLLSVPLLNNGTTRNFRNKKNMKKLKVTSFKGINEFKKDYQSRNNSSLTALDRYAWQSVWRIVHTLNHLFQTKNSEIASVSVVELKDTQRNPTLFSLLEIISLLRQW
jgi:hypothetical protein